MHHDSNGFVFLGDGFGKIDIEVEGMGIAAGSSPRNSPQDECKENKEPIKLPGTDPKTGTANKENSQGADPRTKKNDRKGTQKQE